MACFTEIEKKKKSKTLYGITKDSEQSKCYRKGESLSRAPRVGSCLTLRKEFSEETCGGQSKRLYWKRALGQRAAGQANQETCSATWLTVSGFLVMGLVSRLSVANHSDSESFLVVHASLSQDGCQREGFWEVERHAASPSDLSQTLPVGGGLLVPYSLPRTAVIKQLMQMVAKESGQGWQFQSLCFLYQKQS